MNSLRAHNAAVSPILSGPAVLIVLSARGSPDLVTGKALVATRRHAVLSARREALVASLCGEEKEVGNLCDAATEVCT